MRVCGLANRQRLFRSILGNRVHRVPDAELADGAMRATCVERRSSQFLRAVDQLRIRPAREMACYQSNEILQETPFVLAQVGDAGLDH